MNPLVILGSTGSVGTQTLDLVRRNSDRYSVEALSGHGNLELLLQQIEEFRPSFVAVTADNVSIQFRAAVAELGVTLFVGPKAILELLPEVQSEIIVVAVLGFAALEPVLLSLKLDKQIALANKESIVAGGDLVRRSGNFKNIVPVDSEHSSVFQLLDGVPEANIRRVALTASGGPFLNRTLAELKAVTAAEAVKHPRWNMGAKISVDSATLMNKGLEVIEAAQLFQLSADRIDVFIHPESVVHGLVELTDGVVNAALFTADMRVPIAYALDRLTGNPRSSANGVSRLDLNKWGTLSFQAPDLERFRSLHLAYLASKLGGTAPTVLNGSNEVAVSFFLEGALSFLSIPEVVEETLERHTRSEVKDLESLLQVDQWSRDEARRVIKERFS